jgi:hypothetical protein
LHLILNHKTVIEEAGKPNEHTIEIQMRTQLQHHWATANEIASAFLGRDLRDGMGDERWSRFFLLASIVFAIIENPKDIPGTPTRQTELVSEIRNLWYELQVDVFFDKCRLITEKIDEFEDISIFLVRFSVTERSLETQGFAKGQNELAIQELNKAEVEYADMPEIQVALVTVDNVKKLKEAYLNYAADAVGFINVLSAVIEPEYEKKAELEDQLKLAFRDRKR